MTGRDEGRLPEGVERMPKQTGSTVVSDELAKLMAVLKQALPPETAISFLYDTRLQVRVDVRTLEHVLVVEMILPTLSAGTFHDIRRGQAPNHSFLHRVTAVVDR